MSSNVSDVIFKRFPLSVICRHCTGVTGFS